MLATTKHDRQITTSVNKAAKRRIFQDWYSQQINELGGRDAALPSSYEGVEGRADRAGG